jgi:DNA-binding NtrC family response regulator
MVVTDHVMPGMTGAELVRRITATHPALPVMLASGYTELAGELLLDITCERIAKPYSLDDLQRVIGRLLGQAQGDLPMAV